MGAALVYWIRRFSPRIEILVESDELTDVYSIRGLKAYLSGHEGVVYSREFLEKVLLIKKSHLDLSEADFRVSIREPSIKGYPLSRKSGFERIPSLGGEGIVLPFCIHSLQIAMYLRESGAKAQVSETSSSPAWFRDKLPNDLFTNKAPLNGLEDLCQDVEIRIQDGEQELVFRAPFLDENIHSLAALIARSIVLGKNHYLNPIPIQYYFLDTHEGIVAGMGDCSSADSSVKTSLGEKAWARLCLEKQNRRIVGFQGILHYEHVSEITLPFIEKDNFCSEKNLFLLAMSKSPFFYNSRLMELLLAAWVKMCS